ncbi:MAG: DUF4157 domain-containing protein, partial [Nitrososphaera sp.]|nr:DUF4157 domain-containing protein [Nitrososphaera sp.]
MDNKTKTRVYDLEKTINIDSRPWQTDIEQQIQTNAVPRRCDPLAHMNSPVGNTASAKDCASALNRATYGQLARTGHSLLQLQRRYGNRHVQRVLALARWGDGEAGITPEMEQAIRRARSGGQALNHQMCVQMGSAFGVNFNKVRVHTDQRADTLNRALNARAFTTGQDIFFRQGEYSPGSLSGRELLAHELTHVVQQGGSAVQGNFILNRPGDEYEQEADRAAQVIRQSGGYHIQKTLFAQQEIQANLRHIPAVNLGQLFIQKDEPSTPATPTPGTGTVEDVVFYVTNPALEDHAGLQAALGLFSRYSRHVRVENVEFRLLPESETSINLGPFSHIGGRSQWEGDTPVIELPQSLLDIISRHVNRSTPPVGQDLVDMHNAIRVIGHELHHLWREKEGHRGNPIQPVFEAEQARRMEEVRQNWLQAIGTGPRTGRTIFGDTTRRDLGIPESQVINTWEDIDEAVRTRIEEGAA